MEIGYDDSEWTKGEGAFGSVNRKPMIHTVWDGPELWVRRTFNVDRNLAGKDIDLFVKTNEYGTIYINGRKVCDSDKTTSSYVKLSDEVTASLVAGANTILLFHIYRSNILNQNMSVLRCLL